jgi:uncharacterized protein (TIGR00251 family)
VSITETKEGVTLKVFVKPNSSSFKIEFNNDEIVVFSTETPVKSKVNKEIIKELTKLFHAKVELSSGATSRQKHLLIRGLNKQQADKVLKET